jgi:hypothetical protein
MTSTSPGSRTTALTKAASPVSRLISLVLAQAWYVAYGSGVSGDGRLDVELALLASHWMRASVLHAPT